MNPLYVDVSPCAVKLDNHSLVIVDKKTEKELERFEPRSCPYDSIVIQRGSGYITFGAINWMKVHGISLVILDWRGNILSQILPEEPISNELKVGQVQAFLDRNKRLTISRVLVETKIRRQNGFLLALSKNYSIIVPKITAPRVANSFDFIRNHEARYATDYFKQFGIACEEIGYAFKGRNATKSNMNASDLPNAFLNYAYSILQMYVRRATNSIGLDNTIPFLHELRRNRGLVYDLMELWRTNCDYSVIQTLEILKRYKRTHYISEGYEVILNEEPVKILLERLKLNLSMQEIIFNCRIFARYLLGKKADLAFELEPIPVRDRFETEKVKQKILSSNFRKLRMNKSTLWYQRKRLEETAAIRLYTKTKQYFT